MTKHADIPPRRPGLLWLTEGGIETEIMYKWGYELPHFAMFPLLERAAPREAIRGIYRRYLDVAARHGMAALVGGFDYRASPDWGDLLGYSAAALADANIGAIRFLQEMAAEYRGDIPDARIVGYVGPRGDAYRLNRTIGEDEAADYHAVQLATLRKAGVDLAWAVTFNNPAEAKGVVRAAQTEGVPLALSFSLASNSRLASGRTLSEAIAEVDAASGAYPAFYALNCSHPMEFEPALAPGPAMERLRSIRPNAAKMDKIALCKLGRLEEGDPVELGEQMADVARRYPNLDIWGGCCGTCETHLEEIARRLQPAREAA
ncbi:homocysteine S-methyltransferase family protein [Acuticoccus mangrovi]|uniref:Homocysteine S-methyltransferase family protein n=1 Tax=Acuticoccus mangrovi TaxID=2796142 RepID=A0A934ILN9_9HYPH|nr:homocysteine S-methyltransferase family protein [Acuticoccus mangrovi]MBJ3774547.1 homocysteine S-methyltransferase family protein [Acuticoccus mangrovi]